METDRQPDKNDRFTLPTKASNYILGVIRPNV